MLNRENQGGALSRRPQGGLNRTQNSGLWGGWDPWREMTEMHRQMDELFSNVFGVGVPDISGQRGQMAERDTAEPDVDIYEDDGEYIIHAALPGIRQEDIQIHATENAIMLSAQSRSPFDAQDSPNTSDTGQNRPTGGQMGTTAGQQPGTTGNNWQAGTQTNAPSSPQAGMTGGNGQGGAQPQRPHTQHRQSRYSRQSRFEFAYTLPEEIKPDQVRATFRDGRLELRLPKMNVAANQRRPITVPIQGGAESPALAGNTALQQGGAMSATSQTAGTGSAQEHQSRSETGTSGASAGAASMSDTTTNRQDMNAPVGSTSNPGA